MSGSKSGCSARCVLLGNSEIPTLHLSLLPSRQLVLFASNPELLPNNLDLNQLSLAAATRDLASGG